MQTQRKWFVIGAIVVLLVGAPLAVSLGLGLVRADPKRVVVEILTPEPGYVSGVGGRAVMVDLEVEFHRFTLAQTGFTAPELTGPGGHANVAPFPSPFGPGADDAFPGLVVLFNNTNAFSGPGTNLAGLFNIVTVVDQNADGVTLWATWITGAPIAGPGPTKLTVAIAADLNRDGVFNDAPNVVEDKNADGEVNAADLMMLGVVSNIVQVSFTIAA